MCAEKSTGNFSTIKLTARSKIKSETFLLSINELNLTLKKIILAPMDPFVHIFSDSHGWVLQHFTAGELLKITLVSPNWSESIGHSAQMLKKVRLEFENPDKIEKIIRSIGEIEKIFSRSYRNVSVDLKFDNRTVLFASLLKYLGSLGPKLRDLRIKSANDVVLSVADEELLDKIDLSRLRFLSLLVLPEGLTNKLMSRCNSLAKLKLYCVKRNGLPMIPCIAPFLERNQDLSDLELYGSDTYKAFFENDISQIVRFNLKHLKIFFSALLPEKIERNFVKFLTKQSQSLESLQVNAFRNFVIEHIFNRMPALKSLRIDLEFGAENLQLKLNENIVDLSIPSINKIEDFKNLIRAVPRLTKLLSHKITSEKIDCIARDLPELEALVFWKYETSADGPVWRTLWPQAVPRCLKMSKTLFYAWIIEK